jgi:hypothetical protein
MIVTEARMAVINAEGGPASGRLLPGRRRSN